VGYTFISPGLAGTTCHGTGPRGGINGGSGKLKLDERDTKALASAFPVSGLPTYFCTKDNHYKNVCIGQLPGQNPLWLISLDLDESGEGRESRLIPRHLQPRR
jgi:hypothetical protein